ncbi:zinc-dependent metalloprotease [Flavobacterium rhizosphaerae]|uniref:Reprolysin-like metallopeptidase n=1 Tax=Flavobacterium rhizosphaerae TaxID=3163298 RepID=A0ABW8YSF6_9FLAO
MKRILLLLIVVFTVINGYAQNRFWRMAAENDLSTSKKTERTSIPSAYNLMSLDLNAFKEALQYAPLRNSGSTSSLILPFPDGSGNLQHFRIYEAPVLQRELSAQHPYIKSYSGQGIEHPEATIRFSVTIFGLHAMLLSTNGTVYTDPYTTDLKNYIVYKKASLTAPHAFGCEVTSQTGNTAGKLGNPQFTTMSDDGYFRTYRLAMACTVEYAAYHISAAGLNSGTLAQKKAAVLAAMSVTMTRVDGVYERDMALTMEIIPNNEDIIFITSDELNNNNANILINQIQGVIDDAVGFNNYDIGHVVSTGAGGLASLGCVCTTYKAQGVTGSPAPVGDPYDIDYVAHEMGHQFGANHTFNGNTGSCNNNANPSTAVEPGSGSTIMAYAGICPGANVQSNSDDYFHTVSITQMQNYISGTGCAEETIITNTPPVIGDLPSYSIPKSTAFVLTGTATDVDGDELTYTWEQTNANGVQVSTPSATATSGPNFRSLPPSESPVRYLPSFSDVLNGNLTPTWEVVPAVGRTLTFAFTVRDNAVFGAQTATQNTSVIVKNTAGPFKVTSQNEEDTIWTEGTQQVITWDVAGTTANGINTSAVNILMSVNGGESFDYVLAANTPNDGSEVITVPEAQGAYCRIMVQAVGNIYYAVNEVPFSIGYTLVTACETYENNTVKAIQDAANDYQTSAIFISDDVDITSINIGVDITHTRIGDLLLAVLSPQNTQVALWNLNCSTSDDLNVLFTDSGNTVTCDSPTTGDVLPYESLAAIEGQSSGGYWVLGFADIYAQNTGTLNSWYVEICSKTSVPLDAAQFMLTDFMLYPNPNNGEFTIQFTAATQGEVEVYVNDIRGRKVFGQTYNNSGLFSRNINLGAVQQGVYLVTVQQGERKEVRKIVIK